MFNRLQAALAALILLAPVAAQAADNYQVKDANGATLTIRSKDTGTGQSPQMVPSDATGAPVTGPAGTPSTSAVSVQGVPNGTAQNVDSVVRTTSTSRSIIIPVAGVSAAIVAGGSGHAVNDILTATGGTCTTQPRYTVATVSSGAVASVTLNTAGSCTVLPPNPSATTSSAAGTGATLTQTYASIGTQVMAANASRRGFQMQPQGSIAFMSGLTTATPDHNSLKLPADALYESLPQHVGVGAVSVICGCAVPLPLYGREF